MDELEFYDGAWTGEEIDEGIRKALNPVAPTYTGWDELTGARATFLAINDNLIFVKFSGVTGTVGTVTGHVEIYSSGSVYTPNITSDHQPVGFFLSNPDALVGELTIETDTAIVAYTALINGTTDIYVLISKCPFVDWG